MQEILISIVIPNLDGGYYLDECLKSVIRQKKNNVEIIVVDGDSSDLSKIIIEKHKEKIAHYESERDLGHYNAINKGMAKAKGKVLMWINSDDILHPGALKTIEEAYKNNPKMHIFTGIKNEINASGIINFIEVDKIFWSHSKLLEIKLEENDSEFLQQESTFFTREIWERYSGLNEEYKLASDYDFWLKITKNNPICIVDAMIGSFRRHDKNRSILQSKKYQEEAQLIRKKYKERNDAREKSEEPETMMARINNITIHTSLYKKRSRRQRDCMQNMRNNGFNIVSVNKIDEQKEVKNEYRLSKHENLIVKGEEDKDSVLINIKDMVKSCIQTRYCTGISNSDVAFITYRGMAGLLSGIIEEKSMNGELCLLLCNRIEVNSIKLLEFDEERIEKGLPGIKSNNFYKYGIDMMIGEEATWKLISEHFPAELDIYLGRPWWDLVLPIIAQKAGIKILVLEPPQIWHETHETNYNKADYIEIGNKVELI